MSLHRVCRGFLRRSRESRSTHARTGRAAAAAGPSGTFHIPPAEIATAAKHGTAAPWQGAGGAKGIHWPIAAACEREVQRAEPPWGHVWGHGHLHSYAQAQLQQVLRRLKSHPHPQAQPQQVLLRGSPLLARHGPNRETSTAPHASHAWSPPGAIRATPAVDAVHGISAVRLALPQRPSLCAQPVPLLPARLLSTAAAAAAAAAGTAHLFHRPSELILPQQLSSARPCPPPTLLTCRILGALCLTLRLPVFASRCASQSGAAAATPGPPKRSWLAVALLLLPCATAFGLAAWQIQRYFWKLDLVERRQQRLQEPPVPLLEALQAQALATGEEATLPLLPPPPATSAAAAGPHGSDSAADGCGSAAEGPGWAAGELEFRRVECEGRYHDARSLFVGPRAHTVRGAQEKGYFLVTPLIPPPGSQQPAVLVNRGWVPEAVRREADAWMAGERARGAAREAGKEEVESGGNGTSRSGGGGSSSSGSSSGGVSVKGSSRGWFGSGGGKGRASIEAETAGSEPNAPPVIRVSGVVRGSEKPNHFVPPNAPEHSEWFWVDVPAMAQACGLPRGTLLLDAMKPTDEEEEEKERTSGSSNSSSSSSGQAGVCPVFHSDPRFPRPKDPEELVKLAVMPTDHITYAATWFSLFTATSVMAYKRLRVVPRKGR
ncbi:unnamed protein product [Closterium sp. Naga37s-1]|nr:unnamed protein product [Closterium sp. Naga37s-1]